MTKWSATISKAFLLCRGHTPRFSPLLISINKSQSHHQHCPCPTDVRLPMKCQPCVISHGSPLDIYTSAAISLMCPPKPPCMQPCNSPHHSSALLISCSLSGTNLARPMSHKEYEMGGTDGCACAHRNHWAVGMFVACVKTFFYVPHIDGPLTHVFLIAGPVWKSLAEPLDRGRRQLAWAGPPRHWFPH